MEKYSLATRPLPNVNYSCISQEIIEQFNEIGCKFLGAGRHRAVFLLPNKLNVIKIPLDEDGICDNQMEAFLRRKYKNCFGCEKANLARCKLLHGTFLIMEYVIHPKITNDGKRINGKFAPGWVLMIDCYQVGYNKRGQLVAYDYAE